MYVLLPTHSYGSAYLFRDEKQASLLMMNALHKEEGEMTRWVNKDSRTELIGVECKTRHELIPFIETVARKKKLQGKMTLLNRSGISTVVHFPEICSYKIGDDFSVSLEELTKST